MSAQHGDGADWASLLAVQQTHPAGGPAPTEVSSENLLDDQAARDDLRRQLEALPGPGEPF